MHQLGKKNVRCTSRCTHTAITQSLGIWEFAQLNTHSWCLPYDGPLQTTAPSTTHCLLRTHPPSPAPHHQPPPIPSPQATQDKFLVTDDSVNSWLHIARQDHATPAPATHFSHPIPKRRIRASRHWIMAHTPPTTATAHHATQVSINAPCSWHLSAAYTPPPTAGLLLSTPHRPQPSTPGVPP